MKNEALTRKNSYLMAVVCLMLTLLGMTACQDTGYGDDNATPQTAFGNDTITEHHVVTLAELRQIADSIEVHQITRDWAGNIIKDETYMQYSFPYDNILQQYRDTLYVKHDVQLKVRVTGNDQGGNIYNKVFVQDANGEAIAICVYAGGMFSYLPVGQVLLVNLKGLYIGTYGYQAQIGTPYTTSSGNTYPGRMANNLWQQHFKLLGEPDPTAANCQPITCSVSEFASKYQKNIDTYAGRLFKLTGVTFTNGGKDVWAKDNNSDFSISQGINGLSSSAVVYTSTSAKFANDTIPTGTHTLTGIFSRYSSTWQIQLRTVDDVQ